jgi:hypothetical protein
MALFTLEPTAYACHVAKYRFERPNSPHHVPDAPDPLSASPRDGMEGARARARRYQLLPAASGQIVGSARDCHARRNGLSAMRDGRWAGVLGPMAPKGRMAGHRTARRWSREHRAGDGKLAI